MDDPPDPTVHQSNGSFIETASANKSDVWETASKLFSEAATKRQYTTDEYLWIYVSPVILLLGLCGNILILLVINRKNLRGTTTCIYLTGLAIFDTLALVSGIIPEWTNACGLPQFSSIHPFTCQLEKFTFYTTSDTAIWILVAFTLDRFVAVCFPLYKRSICVPKRSKIACLVIFILAFIKNFHVFWTRTLEPIQPNPQTSISPSQTSNTTLIVPPQPVMVCSKRTEFKNFESLVRPWIAFGLVSVLPFTILVISNAMIIWVLARLSKTECKTLGVQPRTTNPNSFVMSTSHRNERESINPSNALESNHNLYKTTNGHPKQLTSGNPSETEQQNRLTVSQESKPFSRQTVRTSVATNERQTVRGKPTGSKPSGGQSYKQTTMMCLSSSITFLVCVFPSMVMLIGKPYWSTTSTGDSNYVYDVCKAINNQLAYLNHSINFFLYCITGRKFRMELKNMFRSCCKCCNRFSCCRVTDNRLSFNPTRSTETSRISVIGGIWRSKLSSIFVSSLSSSTTAIGATSTTNVAECGNKLEQPVILFTDLKLGGENDQNTSSEA